LDLLYDFCRLRDRFLGVYIGSKSLVATKVRRFMFVVGNGILP
jgi:hypothetical protein